jgi:dihydroorotate dehydrogenase (NAD+) catalytic subunit
MLIDIHGRKPVIGNVSGGISGPAILPMGVYLTWRAAAACSLPVIGIGGIRSGEDALQYILAGAHLVQVGTASFVDPAAAATVQEEISSFLVAAGIGSLSELVGGLRLPEHAQA